MKKYIIILLILKSNITYCQSYKDYFNSGFIKDSLGEYYDAIRDFTFAIELNSNCAPCYLLRYKTAKKIEDYNTSISDISILMIKNLTSFI
jgi:tetratricopeptide (TPR) repeat protein